MSEAHVPAFAFLLLVALLAGCGGPDGDARAERGAALAATYGCGACHAIPGVAGARGLTGPPLAGMGRRAYIAGVLANTPANMVAWLQEPQRIVPGNAMPDLAIGRDDARALAAYIEQLR
jgi:cytochrome c2